MQLTTHLLVCMCVFLALAGCRKDDATPPAPVPVDQMVLVYIAANNDLQADALRSIQKMEAGFHEEKGRALLVFAKTSATSACLLRIRHDESKKIISDTIKTYNNGNSADPAFLQKVIADARQLQPARSYGLVLWSHATSWAPPANGKVIPESFGYDDEREMDIRDLKNVIPDDLEYILFDACSMGSIEVCYELKNKAKYLLVSPAEVLSTSFPYDEITGHLFEGPAGLRATAEKFIRYYKAQPGLYASATVSLIDTRLLDSIALAANSLLQQKAPVAPFNRHYIQQLDFQKPAGVAAYDFISFLKNNYKGNEYTTLQRYIEQAVMYKGATDNFLGIPVKEFCGLSVYLPEVNDTHRRYYGTLRWSVESGWSRLFF